jgi:hypothetical protein
VLFSWPHEKYATGGCAEREWTMRGIFGLVSLVVVVAIVGVIAARQLRATRDVAAAAGGASAPATGTVREQSQALQKQVGADVAGSLQKAADQRGDDAAK